MRDLKESFHNVSRKSINCSGLSILMHCVISLPEATRRHMINWI